MECFFILNDNKLMKSCDSVGKRGGEETEVEKRKWERERRRKGEGRKYGNQNKA